MDNEPENTSTPSTSKLVTLAAIASVLIFLLVATVGFLVGGIGMGVREQTQFDTLRQQARQSQLDLQTTKSECEQQLEIANKPTWDLEVKLARQDQKIAQLQQEVRQASAKTGTPTARVLLEQTADAVQMATSSAQSLNSCVNGLEKADRFMRMSIEIMGECNQAREDDFRRMGNDYTLINDVNGSTVLLNVIRQHVLAVGLENLTLADDGLVYEASDEDATYGNGALFFQDCSDSERGCQEMAIQTTVYSTDPTAELFLDKPVNLDEIEL